MANDAFYQKIKEFPKQFKRGLELSKDLTVLGDFDRVVVCGMGGSALYAELVNDYLASTTHLQVDINRSASLPNFASKNCLFVISSYSGNTQETLACFNEVHERGFSYVVFTSGGTLLTEAKSLGVPIFQVPSGIQPRVGTGYFTAGLVGLLTNLKGWLPHEILDETLQAVRKVDALLDEKAAQNLAKALCNRIPLVYTSIGTQSLARFAKISFNEASKTPAFFNIFPEQNHNELESLEGKFNDLFYCLILESKFASPDNRKRIKVFLDLAQEKGLPIDVYKMKGDSLLEELLSTFYFLEHLTYYLALEYAVDPEKVVLIEEFKRRLGR